MLAGTLSLQFRYSFLFSIDTHIQHDLCSLFREKERRGGRVEDLLESIAMNSSSDDNQLLRRL